MELICESKRDQRTLQWLVARVGEAEVVAACLRLTGARRTYPSNVAKVLGLAPPRSLACPTPAEAKANIEAILRLLKREVP